jgi:hypothetical protein
LTFRSTRGARCGRTSGAGASTPTSVLRQEQSRCERLQRHPRSSAAGVSGSSTKTSACTCESSSGAGDLSRRAVFEMSTARSMSFAVPESLKGRHSERARRAVERISSPVVSARSATPVSASTKPASCSGGHARIEARTARASHASGAKSPRAASAGGLPPRRSAPRTTRRHASRRLPSRDPHRWRRPTASGRRESRLPPRSPAAHPRPWARRTRPHPADKRERTNRRARTGILGRSDRTAGHRRGDRRRPGPSHPPSPRARRRSQGPGRAPCRAD